MIRSSCPEGKKMCMAAPRHKGQTSCSCVQGLRRGKGKVEWRVRGKVGLKSALLAQKGRICGIAASRHEATDQLSVRVGAGQKGKGR